MSRSGYSENCEDQWGIIRWRGAVNSAIKGRRGQSFLKEMLAAMDSLEQKRLISDDLENGGEFCAIGTVGHARGVEMANIDPENTEGVASIFCIPRSLAAEIVYMNDEYVCRGHETPEERFVRMRKWVVSKLTEEA